MEEYSTYLEHHGILGQRWGIRRTPEQLGYPSPKPRKTADGKIGTYDTKGHVTTADYGINKSKLAKNNKNPQVKSNNKAVVTINRKDYSNTSNGNKTTKKYELSKSEKNIARAIRKNKGVSQEEAEKMAVYQNRAKKIAIAVAAGALVAGTAYVVVKSKQNPYKDFTIIPGSKIQRITPFDDNKIREQFYGAVNKSDKNRYIFGMSDWKGSRMKLYQQEMIPQKPIKVAGINTCEKLFNELKNNDKDFSNALARTFGPFDFQRVNYAHFNQNMIYKVDYKSNDNCFQLFQNALKEKGYGGLIDHNDAKGMGWGTERPVIFFGQQDNLSSTVRELTSETVSNARKDYAAINRGRQLLEESIGNVAITGTVAGSTGAYLTGYHIINGASVNNKIIKEYKDLHPNSKLSDAEILDMYDKS